MNISSKRLWVVLVSVSALGVTTGCGDETVPEDSGTVSEVGQAEFAILRADIDSHNVDVDVSDILMVDVNVEQRNLMMAAIQNDLNLAAPDTFAEYAEINMHSIPDSPSSASQLTLESHGPVCANIETWKEFAHKTCSARDARLTAISTSIQCGEDYYNGAVFQCVLDDENGREIEVRKFETFTLGGQSTCKPYQVFADHAAELCGGAQNLSEKHILGSCDRYGSEDGFTAIRFTCER
jgi:hypothetical protein